ncbi:hypothetical protein NC652_031245 [Populus alba x Populus x berolinensis]|nr:hypothetical protein NC652_031245 [Populus alba x Populus x berolinensis]
MEWNSSVVGVGLFALSSFLNVLCFAMAAAAPNSTLCVLGWPIKCAGKYQLSRHSDFEGAGIGGCGLPSFGPLLLEETQQEQLAWTNLDTETSYMQDKVKHKNQQKAEAKGEFLSLPLLQCSVLLQSCRKIMSVHRVYIHGQIRTSSLMSTKSKPHA